MIKDKDILRGYLIRLFTESPEEVLEYPGLAFCSAAGTRVKLFFYKKGIYCSLPAGGSIGEVGNRGGHGVTLLFIVLATLFIALIGSEAKGNHK